MQQHAGLRRNCEEAVLLQCLPDVQSTDTDKAIHSSRLPNCCQILNRIVAAFHGRRTSHFSTRTNALTGRPARANRSTLRKEQLAIRPQDIGGWPVVAACLSSAGLGLVTRVPSHKHIVPGSLLQGGDVPVQPEDIGSPTGFVGVGISDVVSEYLPIAE